LQFGNWFSNLLGFRKLVPKPSWFYSIIVPQTKKVYVNLCNQIFILNILKRKDFRGCKFAIKKH